jgi:hypothetical protein
VPFSNLESLAFFTAQSTEKPERWNHCTNCFLTRDSIIDAKSKGAFWQSSAAEFSPTSLKKNVGRVRNKFASPSKTIGEAFQTTKKMAMFQ